VDPPQTENSKQKTENSKPETRNRKPETALANPSPLAMFPEKATTMGKQISENRQTAYILGLNADSPTCPLSHPN